MQAQAGVFFAGVGEHGGVGDDNGIGAETGGGIDRLLPARHLSGLDEGVDRHQHLPPACVGVSDAFGDAVAGEVEAGEVARVGGVFQAEIDGIGAVINGGFQGGQVAGGADQFGDFSRHDGLL